MLREPRFTSTKTAVAPARSTTLPVTKKLCAGMMTSSPGPIPISSSATCMAAVAEVSARTGRPEKRAESSFSKAAARGPVTSHRVRSVSATAAIIASSMVGRAKGRKSMVLWVAAWRRSGLADEDAAGIFVEHLHGQARRLVFVECSGLHYSERIARALPLRGERLGIRDPQPRLGLLARLELVHIVDQRDRAPDVEGDRLVVVAHAIDACGAREVRLHALRDLEPRLPRRKVAIAHLEAGHEKHRRECDRRDRRPATLHSQQRHRRHARGEMDQRR